MRCSDFYKQIRGFLNPTGFIANADGIVSDLYFGNGYQVVFCDHWEASDVASLKLLQDINCWEHSSEYVEAHYYESDHGVKCVSLSASNNPQFDSDVEEIHTLNGHVQIRGQAH